MAAEPASEQTDQAPESKPRRSLGERVRSFARRWTGRLAPRDDETERTPIRTTQKLGLTVIALGALGFWVVVLYLIVT